MISDQRSVISLKIINQTYVKYPVNQLNPANPGSLSYPVKYLDPLDYLMAAFIGHTIVNAEDQALQANVKL